MIEITTITGKKITLVTTEATIELNNSLFNDGSKFAGSYSFPLNVAWTNSNKVILGYAHALETGVKKTDIPVFAKIGGKNFRRCILRVEIGDKTFDCNLEIDLGTLNTYIGQTKLNQVTFEYYNLGLTTGEIESSMMLAAANTDWRQIPYTFFPIRNQGFTGGVTAAPVEEPVWSGNPDDPIAGPTPYSEVSTLINSVRLDGDQVKFNVQTVAESKGRYHITPYFYLPYVLTRIAEQLGFTLKGDFIQHADVAKIVVYNVNDTFITRYGDARMAPEEITGLSFKADDHLPNVTISEFFKILSAYFCVRITPDLNAAELNISWKKSTFEKPVYKNWTTKTVKFKKQEFDISDGYKLTAQIDKLPNEKDQPVESVTVGAGKDPIDIKAGSLRKISEPMPGTTDKVWEIPCDTRAGNIVDPIFRELENFRSFDTFNDFPVRFVMTKGVGNFDVNPIPYPRGTIEGAKFSLTLQSLNAYAIEPWYNRTYAGKKGTVNFLLTAGDICELKDSDIILFKSDSGATIQAIFEKITFTSKRDTKVLAEAELILLDSAAIREPNTSGIYVKVTESNARTSIYERPGSIPGSPPAAHLISYETTIIDVTIQLFADKNCTVPLNGSGLYVFLQTTKSENRLSWYIDGGAPADQRLRSDANPTEGNQYRKILFNGNQVVLSDQLKKSTHRYYITTGNINKYNLFWITRENSFKVAESDNYITAE